MIGPAFLIGGDILKGPDRHNSPSAYREEDEATETERVFVLNLNGSHQDDAANGQGGYYIEKRFHGFSPVIKNADQTSLFLSN